MSVIDKVLAEEDREDGPLRKGIAELVDAVEKQNLDQLFPVHIQGGFVLQFRLPTSMTEQRKFLTEAFEFAQRWIKKIDEKAYTSAHRKAMIFAKMIDENGRPLRPEELIEDFIFIFTLMRWSDPSDKITQVQATRILRNPILAMSIVDQLDKNFHNAIEGLEWAGYAGKKKDMTTTLPSESAKRSVSKSSDAAHVA